jgi:hypothetical protein
MAKVRTKVNSKSLTAALIKAEKNGALPHLSALWQKVSEIYNSTLTGEYKEITPSVVIERVKELGLTYKTTKGKRGRASTIICEDTLAASIQEAEKDGGLVNRGVLWEKVAELYNANLPEGYSKVLPSTVYVKVRELNLPVKTEKGKRSGGVINFTGKRKSKRPKAEEFAENFDIQQSLKEMRQRVPLRLIDRLDPILKQIAAGSRSAGVKLHCLECSGYVSKEVRECVMKHCALYPFRPYQQKISQEEEELVGEEEETLLVEEVEV